MPSNEPKSKYYVYVLNLPRAYKLEQIPYGIHQPKCPDGQLFQA